MKDRSALDRMIDRMPFFMHPEIDRIENWADLLYQTQVEIDAAEGGSVDPPWTSVQFARAKRYEDAVRTAIAKQKPNPTSVRIINRERILLNPSDGQIRSEIEAIIEQAEYDYYGLRVVTKLSDQFTDDWLRKHGLPTGPVTLYVGQIAPISYRWEDGELTEEELNGTSAVEVRDIADIAKALKLIKQYAGRQIVLLGSNRVTYGEDELEIIMRDAIVLAVWER